MNSKSILAISFILIVGVASFFILDLQTSNVGKIIYLGLDFSGETLNAVGVPLVGAKVYLVPTTSIDMTPIKASDIYYPPYKAESYDEPLEDAIRNKGDEFPVAVTDINGNFIFPTVPDGKFFVYVIPSDQDKEHLPGGDRSRLAYTAETLRGMKMPIKMSSSPPSVATYVGTTKCIECHPQRSSIKQTGHKLSWLVPDNIGGLQDYTRYPEMLAPLSKFREADDYKGGTHLELGDYDSSRTFDKFKIREFNDSRLPIDKLYFDTYLWKKKGKYFITMENRINPNDPKNPVHLEVKIQYGGTIHRVNYIVSIPPNLGERKGSYVVLQYQPDGDDKRFNRERRVWRDYYFDQFWDPGNDSQYGTEDDIFKAPPINNNTMEAICAGCHLNGYERYKDSSTGQYLVSAVDDPKNGEINIDADFDKDEINIGCEKCHGPGSRHIVNPGRFIVNPKSLSSERTAALCGRCHDRREGKGDYAGLQPLNEKGEFMKPGESRDTLLKEYSNPTYKGPKPGEDVWPDDIFPKKPNQQYSDFIKSKLYRNDRLLVTCTDCHNPHGTQNRRLLLYDPDNSSSPLCQRCHTIDVRPHMENRFGQRMKGRLTLCIECHMSGTANDMQGGTYGAFVNKPPYNSSEEEKNNVYWHGKSHSHTFKVPLKKDIGVKGIEPSKAMPIPFTNSCGTCHSPFIYKLPYN